MQIETPSRFAIAQQSIMSDYRVTHEIRKVYVALTLLHQEQQGQRWPARKEVAARVGCTVRFVGYALQRLAHLGYLERRRHRNDGSNRSGYRFPRIEDASRLTGLSASKASDQTGRRDRPKVLFSCDSPQKGVNPTDKAYDPAAPRYSRILSACRSQFGGQRDVCIPAGRAPLRTHVWQLLVERSLAHCPDCEAEDWTSGVAVPTSPLVPPQRGQE